MSGKNLKKGDYAHWKGYGLVKIEDIEFDSFQQPLYKVRTGVSGSGFSFGAKHTHGHDLSFVSNEDAANYKKRMKERS